MRGIAGSDLGAMVAEILTGCVIGGLIALFARDREMRYRRNHEDERTRQLAIELALHVAERTPCEGDLRVPRRMVERILMRGARLDADPAAVRAAALAAALPPGATADTRLPLPDGTRAALAFRHARFDGLGLPPGVGGAGVPLPAQLLAAADWLEMRDGASQEAMVAAIADESGRRFSPTLASNLVGAIDGLMVAGPTDGHLGMRVTSGALLVVGAVNPDAVANSMRPAFLAALESRLRERLRPADRVYCTDTDVVAWLSSTTPDGAIAAMKRLEPLVARVPVPSIQRMEVACRIGLAVADSDATSFSELLRVARARSRAAEARRVA